MVSKSRGWHCLLWWPAVALTLLTMGVVVRTAALDAHPIHTTLAQLAYDAKSRSVIVLLRVFADDFAVAVGRHSGISPAADHSVPDQAAHQYVRSRFSLADDRGRHFPLEWRGAKRTGDVVWLSLRAPSAGAPRGLRVLSALLFEVHTDQVNIVQSALSGKSTSTLFTRGDRARTLP